MEMHTRDSLAAIHGLYLDNLRLSRRSPIVRWIRLILAAWAERRRAARLAIRLSQLDDRMLRGIGIERYEMAA